MTKEEMVRFLIEESIDLPQPDCEDDGREVWIRAFYLLRNQFLTLKEVIDTAE